MSIVLSKEAIEEFTSLWLKEYGTPIDENLAKIYANKLMNLFYSIYRPIPNTDKIKLDANSK